MPSPADQDILDVLGKQRRELQGLQRQAPGAKQDLDTSIRGAEELLRELGVTLPVPSDKATPVRPGAPAEVPSWNELLTTARQEHPAAVRIEDLLTATDIGNVDARIHQAQEAVLAPYRLDVYDVAIAGIAGVLASIVDIILVQFPPGMSRFGQPARAGGPLDTWVRDLLKKGVPEDLRRQFEASCKVPYDASINIGLGTPIPGLTPSTHRLHSLGHDPLLGFIFGVADILRGTFTAIGRDGQLISQITQPERAAASLFEAVARQFGHLLSDMNTPAGLPVPFAGLLQLFQGGSLTEHGYSVAELSRLMYRDGYDFRHFLATTIPVLIIEVVVRVAFFARQLKQGKNLKEAFPGNGQPRLQTMLLIAHGTASGINAGKVIITKNPMGVNLAQWGAFAQYLLPEIKLRLIDLPKRSNQAVLDLIDSNWVGLNTQLEQIWQSPSANFQFQNGE